MAQIKNIDQMIAESFATVEKMREDSRRADKEYEESKKRWEVEQKRWELEREESRRRWEQEKKESEARVDKYNAEREKAQKETKYFFLGIGGGVLITSIFSILSVILNILK